MATRSFRRIAAIALGIGQLLAPAAWAQSSASYRLGEHVFNSGGASGDGAPSSASYRLSLVAIGEGVVVVNDPSASYDFSAGFTAAYPPPGEVLGLAFEDDQTLTWVPERSVGVYNVYRGQVDALSGLLYGTCAGPRIPENTAQDFDTPAAGETFFYLVTAVNRLAEEGTKGSDSLGSERTGDFCP